MLASFHACGTEPTSQALVISWCSLLNRLSPPCFHTSAGIPSPPGALPSFRSANALAMSAMVGISSRFVLVMRWGMLSRASWSMSPGTLSSFWKCSLHLATTFLLSEKVPIPSVDFRWTGPFILGPQNFLQSTVEALHVLSVSSPLQLHCLPFPPVWLQCTGAFLYQFAGIFVCCSGGSSAPGLQHSLLPIRVCSAWSLGSNQSWCFLSGLPRYVLGVLYTTCCRAAHFSSGVELSFSSHWARALSISCSKRSPCGWWYLVLLCWA